MQTNFLVIGSGIAGLNFALQAAQFGQVMVITKKKLIDANTNWAQGGIAGVLNRTDDVNQFVSDTIKCGSYHNDDAAVQFLAENSAAAIKRLIQLGVEFEKEHGELKLTQEGGHSQRRIAYVGDYTGKAIETILVTRIKENPNITIYEDTFALDLITENGRCFGTQVIQENEIKNIYASSTILATGGIGQLYKNTTNPEIATGDGIAMGHRAGCATQDLEFIQFHPTAFDKDLTPRFLISETVRGEGAKLVDPKGNLLMKDRHPLADLAPRDIIAREIYKSPQQIYLDSTHESRDFLEKRFPKIYQTLTSHNIHMEKDLIPVTPAAHYLCGGIVTDLQGQTNLQNLFAFGEVTRTGVHGANRLASNSLLEALVFSNQVAQNLSSESPQDIPYSKPDLTSEDATSYKQQIQDLMWQYAGIERDLTKISQKALPKIDQIIHDLNQIPGTNQSLAEVRNMALAGKLILQAAEKRPESLGCHFVN